jgi:hypothetical protein|nr:MAG TPA: hypothetical protein [Caudoviricetes sp.]
MALSYRNGECPVEIASAQSEARGLKLCAICVNRKMHIRHVLMSQNASASVEAFCFINRMACRPMGTIGAPIIGEVREYGDCLWNGED